MEIQNIFNRPPSISEDTLQYEVYPLPENSDRAAATTFAVAIQSYVDSVLQDFVWHRDPFELKVVKDPDSAGWMLSGRMRVGDSVDDEWAMVWLLREISAKWELAISVYDSDGDFMLIEAAEVLPRWVTPSNTENRVWIYKSRLHLISPSHVSPPSSKRRRRALPGARETDDERGILKDEDEEFLSVPDALKLLRDSSVRTEAPAEVENTVWQRISRYPRALKEHTHKTKAYVPVEVAKALSAEPSLVQRAVETFYTRDDIQLRAAQRMSRFPPEPSTLKNIKMTRPAYAQLVGQKFYPPRVFGRWSEKEGTPQWRWRDIGMKIAVGFEMLYQESKGRAEGAQATRDTVQSSADARKDALRRDPEYVKYVQSLQSAGYFRGEAEGSQLWKQLEEKAVKIFIQTRQADDASRASFAASVNAAILHAPPDSVQPSDEPEDSDDWLNISAEDLDTVLQKKLGKATDSAGVEPDAMDVDQSKQDISAEDRAAREEAKRLQNLATKVEEFLKGEGDIEGARFEEERSSDEMSEFSDEASAVSDSGSEAGYGEKKVGTAAEKAARQEAMDKLVPGIDPSEYGRMPASYSMSQRVARTTVETEVVEEVVSVAASREEELRRKPVRAPIIMRDRYEGVDSDDETDEEDVGVGEDEEEEEDRPQVVGEVEVNMEEEQDEFLEFAREALGISNDQWQNILSERKSRGAFVPSHFTTENRWQQKKASPDLQASFDQFAENEPRLRQPISGPRPSANPKLDSFEAVMQAMDAELARNRSVEPKPSKLPQGTPASEQDKGKGKAKEPPAEENVDIEAAMEAELNAALERGDEEDIDLSTEGGMDYNLIKNFLESFKSQGGLPGPVSSLAGRLQPGYNLPRDD